MSYQKYFIRVLEVHYPQQAQKIIRETEEKYVRICKDVAFSRSSPNPMDKRLDFTAYFLAFILVLEQRGEPYERIKDICLRITQEYIGAMNRLQQKFKQWFPRLINTWPGTAILKLMDNKVKRKGHPEGFRAKLITDKAETYGLGYGIDILECGICKLFQKHNAGKYTSILCEVDHLTSQMAGLKLIRSGTLATGAARCDFRFKKI